jgi:hypothetical protein
MKCRGALFHDRWGDVEVKVKVEVEGEWEKRRNILLMARPKSR